MAEIYNYETAAVETEGLQSAVVCDEAIQAARRIAANGGEPVVLEDDGDEYAPYVLVHPDGSTDALASDWAG